MEVPKSTISYELYELSEADDSTSTKLYMNLYAYGTHRELYVREVLRELWLSVFE